MYERRAAAGLDDLVARDGRRRHPGRARRRRRLPGRARRDGPVPAHRLAPHRHPPGVPAAVAARVPPPDRARAAERRLRGRDHPLEPSCTRCPAASRTPATSARCTRPTSVGAVREALEPQNIRFVYEGDQENGFYCLDHLTFTFLSDFTYNRVGYVDVDIDDLDALGLGEGFTLSPDEQATIDAAVRAAGRATASTGSCSGSTTWPRASSPASARTPSSSTSRWSRTTSGAPTTSPR